MKKFFAIAAAVFMFACYAWSQPITGSGMTDEMHANFEVNVVMPLNIVPPQTIQLGSIAPGSTTTLDPSIYRMEFNVSGSANLAVIVSGVVVDATGSSGDCLLHYSWQYYTGTSWSTISSDQALVSYLMNLDATGHNKIACAPNSIVANSNATQGIKNFEVVVSTTYQGM